MNVDYKNFTENHDYEDWLLGSGFSYEDQKNVVASIIINAIDNAYDSLGPGREERNIEIVCEALEAGYMVWSLLWSKYPQNIDPGIFENICESLIGEYPEWQAWRRNKFFN